MKAIVSHIRMDVSGGAEYMTAIMANILSESGFDVTLVTGTSLDRVRFAELTGEYIDDSIQVRKVPTLLSVILHPSKKVSNAALTFYRSKMLLESVKKENPDIVLVDDEVFQQLSKIRHSYGTLIHYVHFPYDNILNIHNLREVKMQYRPPLNLALQIYAHFALKHITYNNFSDALIANSNYTKLHCKRVWDRSDVRVLYPPVNTRLYKVASKENICLVVGRIAPDKNLGVAIRAFASPILKKYRLIITGQIIKQYEKYAQSIMEKSKGLSNVEFVVNPSRGQLVELLSKAKVLLHPRVGEHFGLVIVEGLASGCIPVVHNSGGPVEIINNGKYGVIYETEEEIQKAVLQAFETNDIAIESLLERSKVFDASIFRKRFSDIVLSAIRRSNNEPSSG